MRIFLATFAFTLLLSSPAFAIPFIIGVSGGHSLANASLVVADTSVDLEDGESAVVQFGTLSVTVAGNASTVVDLNLSFTPESGGVAGTPSPQSPTNGLFAYVSSSPVASATSK